MRKFYKGISFYPYNLTEEELSSFYGESEIAVEINTTQAKLEAFLSEQPSPLLEITEAEFNAFVESTAQGQNIWELKKQQRTKALQEQLAQVKAQDFNADEVSMDRFSRLLAIANYKYNQAIAQGTPKEEALSVYATKVQWKNADNVFIEISLNEIATLLEAALLKMQVLWQEY